MTILALLISTPVYAVNYGEPGHNPGNSDNPGIGGPPENNGNNSTSNTIRNSISNYNRVTSQNTNVGINTNTNKAYGGSANSKSTSKSYATGGNSYATGGNATSSAYSGGNTQSVVIDNPGNIKYDGSYTVKTVGIAPDVTTNNTAHCRIAVGGGGGWIGGALSFFGSVLDEGCDVWRDHENLSNAGYKNAADMRLCDKPEVAKLLAHCVNNKSEVQTTSTFVH